MFEAGFNRLGPRYLFGSGIERELRRLHGEGSPAGSPAINIFQNDQGAVLTAEVPGIGPDEIGITVKGNTVTLEITRRDEQSDGRTYMRRERGDATTLTRTVELPFSVEADQAKATFERGVLYLTLPQAEAERPIKITVN